jgi:hypothetical protein
MNYNKMIKIADWIANHSQSAVDEIVWILEHLSQDKLKSIADTLEDELEILEGGPNNDN